MITDRLARALDNRLRLSPLVRRALAKVFPDHWSFMFGEIALYYPDGNIRSVAATADVDIPEGARAIVVGTHELNLVVAPHPGTPPA